jgi:ribosomal protein S18 acetylase RimI-like enzyme
MAIIIDETNKKKLSSDEYALEIMRGEKQIGLIKVLKNIDNIYWLEYYVLEDYRRQGVINEYLPEFFKLLRKKKIVKLMCQVQENNFVSKHILEKHNFVLMKKIKDSFIFVRHLDDEVNKLFQDVVEQNRHLI